MNSFRGKLQPMKLPRQQSNRFFFLSVQPYPVQSPPRRPPPLLSSSHMLVCLRRGLSLVRQRAPRFLPSPPPRPARRFLHHLPAAHGMGEGSAAGKDAKGKAKPKAPTAASAPVVARDESYLEAVTNKRVRMFEEIQARQALHRLNIGGEAIK